ncbi:MAG: rhodanese-like domain-containing protein, partial [Chloroflexota bacterium]
EAGARTQLAAIMSAVWALLAMLVFAPAAAFIPRPALAGVIVVTGSRMVNINGIRQIMRTSNGDAVVMAISFITPLVMPLEYAVLSGILVSFAHFIFTTATPTVTELLPEDDFRHLSHQPDRPGCPQLSILSIMGSLYFGAAPYVEDAIRTHQQQYPERKFLILRFNRVNHMDISGIHMLETIVKLYRDNDGDIFLVGVREKIRSRLIASGVGNYLGEDHFLEDENAITHVFFKILDPAICVYHCRQKVWRECQSLPKSDTPFTLPSGIQVPRTAAVPSLSPQVFWERINASSGSNIEVIDIREPAEYNQGHLRVAKPVPMRQFLDQNPYTPVRDKEVIFVCRNGRRSHQLAYYLQKKGYSNVLHLEGGMTALEVAALPKGR